jgi:hypothetical protein
MFDYSAKDAENRGELPEGGSAGNTATDPAAPRKPLPAPRIVIGIATDTTDEAKAIRDIGAKADWLAAHPRTANAQARLLTYELRAHALCVAGSGGDAAVQGTVGNWSWG